MGDENLTSGSINLTYRRNDTFIKRVFEQVGISDNLLSNFFAGVTLFASKGTPEGLALFSFISMLQSNSWLNKLINSWVR